MKKIIVTDDILHSYTPNDGYSFVVVL